MTSKNTSNDTSVTPAERPYEKLIRDLAGIAQLDSANGTFDIAATAIDGIMQAETLEEIFDANDAGPQSMKDSEFLGTPLSVYDVMWRKSDAKYTSANGGGLGVYCVFDAYLDTGETMKFTVGAPNVVASFRTMQLRGLIKEDAPARVVIKSRPTENGVLLTVGRPPTAAR